MIQVHTVWSIKNKVIENNAKIYRAIANKDTLLATKLQNENRKLKREALKRFGVIIDY